MYPKILDTGTIASVASIDATGFDLRVPAMQLDGASIRTVIREDEGDHFETRIYLTAAPIAKTDALPDILATGGVLLTQRPSIGNDAQAVIKDLGKLAYLVHLGSIEAALTWGAPIPKSVRPFGLYWSESGYDLSIISGLATADETVTLAESIYCN